LKRYERIFVEIVLFERWVGHFEQKFQGEGGRPPTTVGVRKLRVPALSRSVVCVILRLGVVIQYWRVTQTDRHMICIAARVKMPAIINQLTLNIAT